MHHRLGQARRGESRGKVRALTRRPAQAPAKAMMPETLTSVMIGAPVAQSMSPEERTRKQHSPACMCKSNSKQLHRGHRA